MLTAVILLIAEFCPPEKRHIISVFKLIQDLLAPSGTKGVSRFQMLIDKLPDEHKARWFAGAALNSSDQASPSARWSMPTAERLRRRCWRDPAEACAG